MELNKNSFLIIAGAICLLSAIINMNPAHGRPSPVTISGELSSDFKNDDNVIIEFNCYDEISFGNTIAFQHYQVTVKDGKFDFKLLPKHDHFYLEIALYAKDVDMIYNPYDKGRLLVRAGDTLAISLGKTDFRFTNPTPERISRQSGILDIQYRFPAIAREAYSDKVRLFSLRKEALDEIAEKKLEVLHGMQHLFSEMEYSQIRNDIISMKHGALLNTMNNALYRDPNLSSKLKEFFHTNFPPLSNDTTLSVLECSGYFPEFVYLRELVQARLSHPQETLDNLIVKIWENLNQSYTGVLRDRVWIDVLLRLGKPLPYNMKVELYKKSKVLIQGKVYRQTLEIWASNHLSQSEIVDFSLEKPDGTLLTPADLRGKVVVMDFWFNGCYPCLVLAKSMKPIINQYQTDSRVIFLGINVDKQKERWLSALASGKYVSPGQLNVYTNGLGKNHPLITHYQITGFPTLMVLDPKGRVYNKTVPVPLSKETSAEFIALIESLKDN